MSYSRIVLSSRIVMAAAIAIVVISGCQINDPTKDLKVIVNTIIRDNTVSVTLNDVITGGVATSIVTVEIQGADAGKVTDEVNTKVTSFTVNYGFFTFAIQNGTSITAASPVKLMLKITSAGYVDITYPITITSTGPKIFTLNMVKKADMAAAGIEQATIPTAVTSDNTGKTTAPIAVQTAMGSQITIAQGTILKDASGSALTGKLTVASTVYYPQASGLIPQGRASASKTIAYPILSASVTVTDALGKVASPTGGTIFVPVDTTYKNPVTGVPFALGDKLQLGYTDPVTGQVVVTGETQYTRPTLSKISNSVKYIPYTGFPCLISVNSMPGLGVAAIYISVPTEGSIVLGTSFRNRDFSGAPIELVYGIGYPAVGPMVKWVPTSAINCAVFSAVESSYGPFEFTVGSTRAYFRIPGNDAIRLSNDVELKAGINTIEYTAPASVRIYDVQVIGQCPNNNLMEIVPVGTVITVYDATGTKILNTITLSETGEARLYLEKAGKYIVRSKYNNKYYEASLVVDANGVPVISGPSVQVIRVDATVSPIVLKYCLMTTDACD